MRALAFGVTGVTGGGVTGVTAGASGVTGEITYVDGGMNITAAGIVD